MSEQHRIPPPRRSEIPEALIEKARQIEAEGGKARIYRTKHGSLAIMNVSRIGEWQRIRRDARLAAHVTPAVYLAAMLDERGHDEPAG